MKTYYIEKIAEEFADRDCNLLTTVYKNMHAWLEFTCNKHPDSVQKVTLQRFQKGQGCAICNGNGIHRTYADIELAFENTNYKLLSKEFRGTASKVDYICNKHPDVVQSIKLSHFFCGHGCRFCASENYSGENNYAWKGGISNLTEYIKSNKEYIEWVNYVLKSQNYICYITGEKIRGKTVHHSHNFSQIRDRALIYLGFFDRKHMQVKDFTQEELDSITCKIREYHDANPDLGVVMSRYMHGIFHKLYGTRNNTRDQVEEFKKRYESGEILNKPKVIRVKRVVCRKCKTSIVKSESIIRYNSGYYCKDCNASIDCNQEWYNKHAIKKLEGVKCRKCMNRFSEDDIIRKKGKNYCNCYCIDCLPEKYKEGT